MIYLVTGLMRSGTSVIAEHLHELGICMGETMRFPPGKAQFDFEDIPFTDFFFQQVVSTVRDSGKIGDFLREYIPNRGDVFGVKSPFVLPFVETFKTAAERLGHEVKVIKTYRPIYDTIHSLRNLIKDDHVFCTVRAIQEKLINCCDSSHVDLTIDIKETWLSPTDVRERLAQLIRSS